MIALLTVTLSFLCILLSMASIEITAQSLPYGCSVTEGKTRFRLHAPKATSVSLCLFNKPDSLPYREVGMVLDSMGDWIHVEESQLIGKFYGYRVSGEKTERSGFDPSVIVADPYSRAVATQNTFTQPARTIIIDTRFDWSGDTYSPPADPRELVIYECHVKDLTAHITSGVVARGTYNGLTETRCRGGLTHLKDLGVTAVEFMPIMQFNQFEPPFGKDQDWNPTERNHWGYMTSFFFAPSSRYASDGTEKQGEWSGSRGAGINEFKQLVKTLHANGIAVILDIVLNHTSHFDQQPLKYIDREEYYRLKPNGDFEGKSGCGNDLRTESPASRKLIVDCIEMWLKEYNVDGFRFDLAPLIDDETLAVIQQTARAIKPNVLLIAEPWGGGKHDLFSLAKRGWLVWNDRFRGTVRGEDAKHFPGAMFAQANVSQGDVLGACEGITTNDVSTFDSRHTVNYIESHDGRTLGDFVRLGTEKDTTPLPENALGNNLLTEEQMKIEKLGALLLLTSQGTAMIHAGQEFGRGKWLDSTSRIEKKQKERLALEDLLAHNSYNLDNETNHLVYRHREMNRELYSFYRGLLHLRRRLPLWFGGGETNSWFTMTESPSNEKPPTVLIRITQTKPYQEYSSALVIFNFTDKPSSRQLPEGKWEVWCDGDVCLVDKPISSVESAIEVKERSGVILLRQ